MYYVVNISSQRVSKHLALSILLNNFNELYNYSLIAYSSKLSKIDDTELHKVRPIYNYFKKNYLKNLSISPIAEKFISISIYEVFKDELDNILDIFNDTNSDDFLKHLFVI